MKPRATNPLQLSLVAVGCPAISFLSNDRAIEWRGLSSLSNLGLSVTLDLARSPLLLQSKAPVIDHK
jgi:hypothetical protein